MTSPDAPASRRDVEHLSINVEKLTAALDALRLMMEMTYLRQDVYREAQKLHDKTHTEQAKDTEDLRGDVIDLTDGLRGEIKGIKDNSRWMWRMLAVITATVLVPALITGVALVLTGAFQ